VVDLRSDIEKILALAEPIAGEIGLEVLEVELKGAPSRRLLRILLDSSMPNRAVTLDDCTAMSRRLGDVLEANTSVAGSYLLEVSSPGVNRPLRTLEHFRRFYGERVKIRLHAPIDGVQHTIARVVAVGDTGLTLETESGVQVTTEIENVERAHLEFEFKVPSKPGRPKTRARGRG
jgi:ribosome maturation factor RimP